jgi:hypothetical protein
MLNDMHEGLCPKKSNNQKKSIFQEYVRVSIKENLCISSNMGWIQLSKNSNI